MLEHHRFSPESEPQPSDAYHFVEMLTSDVMLQHSRDRIDKQISGDPALSQLSTMQAAKLEATRHFYQADTIAEQQEYSQVIEDIDTATGNFPQETIALCHELTERRRKLDQYKMIVYDKTELESSKLLEIIENAPKFQQVATDNAPFRNYSENNRERWHLVDDESIRKYLTSRIFYDTGRLHRELHGSPSLVIESGAGDELSVPTDLLVNAQGFDSWLGRQGVGSGKDVSGEYEDNYPGKVPSLDVIKHYAGLPSELPAVSEIHLYVQPNGIIFGDNGSGDSHRLAAALLRGDSIIKIHEIHIQAIGRNIFKPLESTLSPERREASELTK